ncbi:MAG TPA: RNA-binding protein [Fimbriimonadales bacterium]|nr:RNA-binding protein [Fimbriimonadales bacterium]
MATKSLYVGSLPYSTTESGLLDLFAPYGALSARIIEGRGFGFVDVPEENAQQAILDKNDSEFGGRRLVVNEARPREEQPRRRYNSGGGGGRRRSW